VQVFDRMNEWWSLPRGRRNAITDVAGTSVGNATVTAGTARTGVTAIRPHGGNMFAERVVAGTAVLNGFGKSTGLVQLQELGEIETPILLTNTLDVPACAVALNQAAIAENPGIGRDAPSVNPLVLECNDGILNDLQGQHVTPEIAGRALAVTAPEFEQGTVGAGTGMRTFGLAGGLGSASRRVGLGDKAFTLGVLVQSNFGSRSELRVLGRRLAPPTAPPQGDNGSIIVVMATDAPLDSRQLNRLAARAAPALGRTGSYMGHGSGDIAVAFSTANRIGPADGAITGHVARFADEHLDPLFLAAVEATEESVLHAMWFARSRPGYDGTTLDNLRDLLGGTPP